MNNKTKIRITEKQKQYLEKTAKFVVSKRMTAPTIFFLESVKPLNYIGSQVMAYLEPIATFIINREIYNDIQQVLEQRDGIEYFLTILEEEEYQKQQKDKEEKERIKNIEEVKKIKKEQ